MGARLLARRMSGLDNMMGAPLGPLGPFEVSRIIRATPVLPPELVAALEEAWETPPVVEGDKLRLGRLEVLLSVERLAGHEALLEVPAAESWAQRVQLGGAAYRLVRVSRMTGLWSLHFNGVD